MEMKTSLLFIVFALLYLLDGYLSLQFVANEMLNEANPIMREAMVLELVYFWKVAVLCIVLGVFKFAEYRGRNMIPIYYGLIAMMLTLNFVSLQMVGL